MFSESGEMLQLNRKNSFYLGFVAGLVIVGLLNYVSFLHSDRPHISHAAHTFGFPVAIYFWGYMEPDRFLWIGLAIDIAIAFLVSTVLGFTFEYLNEKFSSSTLK